MGHAYLYIKDDNGTESLLDDIWYKTEYNVPEGTKLNEVKSKAKVTFYTISNDEMIADLSRKYISETLKINQTSKSLTVGVGGVQYVPIKGDFSASLELAQKYNGTDYGGYNLFDNNCLHYAKEILRTGTAENQNVENFLNTSDEFIPDSFYYSLCHVRQTISYPPNIVVSL